MFFFLLLYYYGIVGHVAVVCFSHW